MRAPIQRRAVRDAGSVSARARAQPKRPAVAQRMAVPGPAHDIAGVPLADVSGRGAIAQRRAAASGAAPACHAPRSGGLPGGLKAGIEAVSGLSMDSVRVHYASPEPARLDAHAFARGADIHLAPGQEHHLAHEAWHVVQQAEGRVRPTLRLGGVAINDDAGLEAEADRMGGEASAKRGVSRAAADATRLADPVAAPVQRQSADACIQRVIDISKGALKGTYRTKGGKQTRELIGEVEKSLGAKLKLGWKSWIAELAGEKSKPHYYTTKEFLDELAANFPKPNAKGGKIRPNFPKSSYWLGAVTREIQTGEDQSGLKPADENLALPHRFPYKAIETSTGLFLSGKEDSADLDRWTGRIIDATERRRDLNRTRIKDKAKRKRYENAVEAQLHDAKRARKRLKTEVESGKTLDLSSSATQEFLKQTNALHGNIPDYGPHAGVNIQVSDRTHLNVEEDGTLTPGSLAAGSMSPHRGRGVARTSDGRYIVTTGGYKFDPDELSAKLRKLLKARGYSDTTIDESDLEEYES